LSPPVEARLALSLCDESHTLDKRISKLYIAAYPAGIVRSAPGVGVVAADRDMPTTWY